LLIKSPPERWWSGCQRRQGTARKFLDAGATEFRLDVESGGRRLIRLADNGSGMLRDDALLASNATPPANYPDVKDLLSIATLGFGRSAPVHCIGVASAARDAIAG